MPRCPVFLKRGASFSNNLHLNLDLRWKSKLKLYAIMKVVLSKKLLYLWFYCNFTKLIFLTWLFVYFKLDFYCLCSYGNTGSGVFKRRGTKLERFLLKNQHTQKNYWILIIGLVGASEVFKNQNFKSQLFSPSHSPT